jgi:pilus assembly protein Flp/PilA
MLTYCRYAASFVVALLRRDDRGVTAVEYGLILALIAGVIIAGLLLLGPALNNLFSNAASCANAPTGCTAP